VKHVVGREDEFASGTITVVEAGGRSLGIVNTGETFYAVLNVCPHELAPVCKGTLTGTMLPSPQGEVEFGLQNRILRCPWHGYEYDLAAGGRAVFSSFKGRLRMFPVSVEDGQVVVDFTVSSSSGRR
jgi:nitrite reductase (NADH) small subunit